MVDKVKIKEWVEALESGNYQQTRGRLKNSEGYCCIGVLGDINNVEVCSGGNMSEEAYNFCLDITGQTSSEVFWEMNDKYGMTFKEIAGKIRRMYDID